MTFSVSFSHERMQIQHPAALKNFIDIHVLTDTRKRCHLVATQGRTVVRGEDSCPETRASQ